MTLEIRATTIKQRQKKKKSQNAVPELAHEGQRIKCPLSKHKMHTVFSI